jgi:uncharacterized protein
MRDLEGKWALITGASSGLGIDFAHLLAERGANLVLVARRDRPMQELARKMRDSFGVKVHVEAMDLSRPGAGTELKTRLDGQHVKVDVLLNNAGYGLFGEFVEQPLAATLDMLQLNMLSLTELTHVFAQDMVRRGHGQILLTASIGGYQATPLYAAYSASKSYVLMFGEALHEELKGKGVTVTVLSPGITATSFLEVSGQKPTLYQRLVMMQSRPVARIGLKALQAGRASTVAGWLNAATAWSNRLIPRFLQRRVAYQLMKN